MPWRIVLTVLEVWGEDREVPEHRHLKGAKWDPRDH